MIEHVLFGRSDISIRNLDVSFGVKNLIFFCLPSFLGRCLKSVSRDVVTWLSTAVLTLGMVVLTLYMALCYSLPVRHCVLVLYHRCGNNKGIIPYRNGLMQNIELNLYQKLGILFEDFAMCRRCDSVLMMWNCKTGVNATYSLTIQCMIALILYHRIETVAWSPN